MKRKWLVFLAGALAGILLTLCLIMLTVNYFQIDRFDHYFEIETAIGSMGFYYAPLD